LLNFLDRLNFDYSSKLTREIQKPPPLILLDFYSPEPLIVVFIKTLGEVVKLMFKMDTIFIFVIAFNLHGFSSKKW